MASGFGIELGMADGLGASSDFGLFPLLFGFCSQRKTRCEIKVFLSAG